MRKTQKPPLKLVGATTTSTAANPFQPPLNLGTSGASAWTSIQNEYQISDAGGLELLNQMCAALDDITSYDEIISHDGIVIRTKTGTRAHPLLKEKLSLRAFVTRTIQRLGLNIEVVRPTSGRPPGQSYPVWEDD